MKKYLLFLILGICWSSCNEDLPSIPPKEKLTIGPKKVLMEVFLGGRCKPCAAAKAEVDNLKMLNEDRLIVVTMHTNSFPGVDGPVDGARYDFRTDRGTTTMSAYGLPLGLPMSYIDRRIFDNEEGPLLKKTQWPGYLHEALEEPPVIGLNVEAAFEETTRELKVELTMTPAEDISEALSLHVVITEDKLIDKQFENNELIEDYQHDHIFRTALTANNGDPLPTPLVDGIPIEKNYTFTMPAEDGWWLAENCNVVAYVTTSEGTNRVVLQAEELHLGD